METDHKNIDPRPVETKRLMKLDANQWNSTLMPTNLRTVRWSQTLGPLLHAAFKIPSEKTQGVRVFQPWAACSCLVPYAIFPFMRTWCEEMCFSAHGWVGQVWFRNNVTAHCDPRKSVQFSFAASFFFLVLPLVLRLSINKVLELISGLPMAR